MLEVRGGFLSGVSWLEVGRSHSDGSLRHVCYLARGGSSLVLGSLMPEGAIAGRSARRREGCFRRAFAAVPGCIWRMTT